MSFILRRLAFYLVAAWVAITLNFFIPRAVPGNPVADHLVQVPRPDPAGLQGARADDRRRRRDGLALVAVPALLEQRLPLQLRRGPRRTTRRPSPRSWTRRSRGR